MSAFTEYKFAWEPITPRGVATFARASLERLFVVQCVCALFAAGVVLWVLASGFFPTIKSAVSALPDEGEINHGKLVISETQPRVLAEGHFLEFNIDLQHGGQIRSPAQFQIEFGEDSILVFSLFGEAEFFYPPDQNFYFNHTDLQPKWDAWSPEILAVVAFAVFFGLLISWILLATIYFIPVWLICFFTNHDLNFRESWRLAGASLMPGALLMTISIWLYGLDVFDLVKLCFAFGMHFVIGWIYLFVSPLFLQRALPTEKKNPFGQGK